MTSGNPWWPVLAVMIAMGSRAGLAEVKAPPARLLVVTVTAGFRHASISTAEPVLEHLGRADGLFHVDFLRMPPGPPQPEALEQQFAKVFAPESLANFDGVIFASTTGELPLPDLAGFLAWIKSGKAFIGIHAATDTLNASDAYIEMIGGCFAGHPWNAAGEHAFVVHEPGHRVAKMFPERFRWKDEIYQYDLRYEPDNLRVLVSLDMQGSTPKEPWHVPVSWVREYGKGRVFSTNFGHNEATWNDPVFQRHMAEGIAWALGRFDAPATPNADVQAAEYLRSVVAAAAAAPGRDADELRAKADARIAKDGGWAVGLRPSLLPIRSLKSPEERAAAYAEVIATIEAAE